MPTETADEIDLRTLLLILRKHFRLFIIITAIVTIGGSIWALRRPQQYSYQQSIQLMHYYVNGKLQPLQSTAEVKQLIENLYLPSFQQQYNQQNPSKIIAIAGLQNGVKKGGGPYSITSGNGILFIQGIGSKGFTNVFKAANTFVFQKINQEQHSLSMQLRKHLQAKISILENQLSELEKLQKAKNNYIIGMQTGKKNTLHADGLTQILHDIYINSLDAQQNQNNLINLKTRLLDLKQQLSSVTVAKLNEMNINVKPTHVSNLMKIVLSFFVGLFLATIVTFIKKMLE